MNTKNNSNPDPEKLFREMVESGEIDLGTITDGLTDSPESQREFDETQKNKPPLIDDD